MRLAKWTLMALGMSLGTSAHAAAFQLYELGTPIIGTAGVGQAAITTDASTAFFNPAGMAFLPGSEFMLGSQMMVPTINFEANANNTISGDNGGNAGTLIAGMNVFYAYNLSPCWKIGVSVTSPYAGSLTYNDGFVGRYEVQTALFYTINLNPSVAYRFNDWLAVAVGGSLEYMNLHQTVATPLLPNIDGQINFKVDDYAGGFNAGVMISPCITTRLGVAYRSKITHDLTGNITFLRLQPTPDLATTMVMPQNVIASIAQDIGCTTLMGEFGWSKWSSMQNTVLQLRRLAVVQAQDWRDTYRVGIAGQYHVSPCLLLQAGASYDSSPTSAELRQPDLPMDRQIRVGAGGIYSVNRAIQVGLSYEYWDLGEADINLSTQQGFLSGSYDRNFSNTLQLSINICA